MLSILYYVKSISNILLMFKSTKLENSNKLPKLKCLSLTVDIFLKTLQNKYVFKF